MILRLRAAAYEIENRTWVIPLIGVLCYNNAMETFVQQILWIPGIVQAYQPQSFPIIIGTPNLTPMLILGNVVNFLLGGGVFVCITAFMLGTFYMVFSRGKEDLLQKGKDLMIGAVVGLAVILGAYGIIRTFFYVLYTI